MSKAVQVGVLVAATNDGEALERFAGQLAGDLAGPLEQASGRKWAFHPAQVTMLESDQNRRGADFVGEASLRLAEGSFDLMFLIIDAPLVSSRDRIVSGVASPLTRICIISTRQLRRPAAGSQLDLEDPQVRWNAAALGLTLIGRVLGAAVRGPDRNERAPFAMDTEKAQAMLAEEARLIRRSARTLVEPEYRTTGWVTELGAHLRALAAKPGLIAGALVRNRAPFLALRLPGLAAAALAPLFILVFTAEMWDAGLGMNNHTAAVYAFVSLAAATLYLTFAQRLFLPRKEGPVLPQHLAVANVVIFTTILLGVLGLFAMLVLFSLALELWVMPRGLISTWPTLGKPVVEFADVLRLAVFISTVGVTTGALAGGLQRRDVLRELAFFERAP